MRVQLEAEHITTIHAVCPEADRMMVGANDWGCLKVIPIVGGTFEGPKLSGKVIPGGADWNVSLGGETPETSPSRTVFAKYLLRTDDGVYIAIENLGYKYADPDKNTHIQTRPSFHAPRGPYEWLNYGVYVGTLHGSEADGVRVIEIQIYRML